MPIYEGMPHNPEHPRAPVLWTNQRHEFTQYVYTALWAGDQRPPLFDGLPEEAATPASGHGWQSEQVIIGTHMGTHIDAALHFDPNASQDAAAIPLERCYGPALLLDLRAECDAEANHPITPDELEAAEARAGDHVREGDIVLINTGHMARYGGNGNYNQEKFFTSYGGLSPDAPAWFIERKVKLVGIDTLNLDCNLAVSSHINFLMRERIGKPVIQMIENLVNLEKIPVPRFTFIGLPLPIHLASGSPVRAVAVIDASNEE